MEKAEILEKIKKQIEEFSGEVQSEEIGKVVEVGDGVAKIVGLKDIMMSEMIGFINEKNEEVAEGVVLNLEEHTVGAIVLGDFTKVEEGFITKRKKNILSVPVGEKLIGRVINPLGKAIDGKGEIKTEKRYPIEKIAPGVIFREPVNTPVQTGVKAIDSMIPIGRGQRELIIGDRQTGKTALAIDTIINQKKGDLVCIYVAIGQKESKIAKTVAKLEEEGALDHTIVVVAGASDPASFSYIAPYAGAAIGEYFMDKGKDALVVYDDLSKHAWAYRQISLLLRRPPSREAYPGDIFYLHSRLLERAAKMSEDNGGGSLTALPIIETQAGDVSAYIPTNVISITDGQIYLESNLFYRGVRPAVNIGLSVSRVGGAAQIKAMKKVAGRLRLDLAQFRELEAFAQFSADLDESTRAQLERGRRLVEILKQLQYEPMPVANQVVILYAAVNGFLDDIEVDKIKEFENEFHKYLTTSKKEILEAIKKEKELTEDLEKKVKSVIEDYKKLFLEKNKPEKKEKDE
ncbi:F0F1 ATP synthase subunit alpha [bacterium]|nr:F0F1 ATP synthase subunit alpha [bacterium]|tara:strand:- start:7393 stop:8943 length:1551 start_codon:yes stop_codon:yes gene_type:complete